MSVSIEFSLDLRIVQRDLNTVLDVFAALGGFESALMLIFGSLVSIFEANTLNNYIAQRLFTFSEKNPLFQGRQASLKDSNRCKISRCCESFHYSCIASCKRNSRQKAMKKARIALAEEADIVEILRSLRFMHMALAKLLGKSQQKELQQKSRFKTIYTDLDDDNFKGDQSKHNGK